MKKYIYTFIFFITMCVAFYGCVNSKTVISTDENTGTGGTASDNVTDTCTAEEDNTEQPDVPDTPAYDNTPDSQYINSLASGGVYLECGESNGVEYDMVSMYQKGNTYYFFLPSYADTDSLILWETVDGNILIDGTETENGSVISLSGGNHVFNINGKDINVKVMQSSNVPAIFINSEDSLSYLKDDKNNCGSGSIAFIDAYGNADICTLAKMNGRGNTSWRAGILFDKYPFNIKLSKATDIFGLASNSKWCLIANVFDESLIRSHIINRLASLENLEFTPASENTDVYYNGEYIGTYLLSQKINIGKNSLVQIYDLEKANEKANEGYDLNNANRISVGGGLSECVPNSYKYCNVPHDPDDITGGYLLEFELDERYADELCGFVTSRGQPVIVKSPEICSKNEILFIRNYIQRAEDAVYSADGINSLGEHYSSLIDTVSFAKVYLINEITMNLDADATSFFMYLDSDSLLKCGPVWDYDWSMGSYTSKFNIDLTSGTGWYVRYKKIYNSSQKDFVATLCSHEEFWNTVKDIFNSSMMDNLQKIIDMIDDYGSFYAGTAGMNFTRFDILSCEPQWGSADTGDTYIKNISYLINFLERRMEFLKSRLQ